MRYVIAYDITNDRQRDRLANLLLDYGDRVQKSVFEAELSAEELKEVLARAAKYLDGEDSLRVYPLCGSCVQGIREIGPVVRARSGERCIV
jgi:CRISPR-associated protein Cas2